MKISVKDTVFVFDLDDTLYKEADYHASGLDSVACLIKSIYHQDVSEYLSKQVASGVKDFLGSLCRDWNLPDTIKESLIWQYRLHTPRIRLDDSVIELISWLEINSAGVVILTDGRSVTQRLKINALGLAHLPFFISDEYGEIKPDPTRFCLINENFPSAHSIYIGDNLAKDFLAPNNLGWTTFCLKDNGRNIHSQHLPDISDEYLPNYWLTRLEELKEFLC